MASAAPAEQPNKHLLVPAVVSWNLRCVVQRFQMVLKTAAQTRGGTKVPSKWRLARARRAIQAGVAWRAVNASGG